MKIRPFSTSSVASQLTSAKATFRAEAYESQLSQSPLEALCALEQWRIEEADKKPDQTRWPAEAMPLNFFCESPPVAATISVQDFFALLSTALKQWEHAGQGLIRFNRTELPAKADLQIQWSNQTTFGRDYEVGHTDRNIQGSWIQKVSITLIEQPLIDQHLSPAAKHRRLYSTLLHEIGHALGLEHSEAKQDMMHHQGWRNTALSTQDIRQLKQLYQEKSFRWL